GYLLFVPGQDLMAQRFDPRSWKLSGPAVTVQKDLALSDASNTGALISADSSRGQVIPGKPLCFDRQGRNIEGLATPEGSFPSLSVDDTQVVMQGTPNNPGIFRFDLIHGTTTRLTTTPTDRNPRPSPDGKMIAFTRYRQLFLKSLDDSQPEPLEPADAAG